jgi:23S rRNA (uracil1939-C5)-methyltransferase
VRIAHGGDGVTADGLFVPYTVPGDVVRIARDGDRGLVVEIVSSGPTRVTPPCKHFGICGGCALQHVARDAYLAWKREQVVTTLTQRGFDNAPVGEIVSIPPATRRRANFKARLGEGGVQLGFYEPNSRTLVDIHECHILVPTLQNLIAPLRATLSRTLHKNETAELLATATDAGIDLSLKLKRARSPDFLMALGELANTLKLARLAWNGEVAAQRAQPVLRVGKFDVALPVEPFLQPSAEGERILQHFVVEAVTGAKRVADLFAGCGTFALMLAPAHRVYAADLGGAMIEALDAAARAGGAGANVTTETRDLFRRPLLEHELKRFDAVVLDPPRPGAKAQSEALAGSRVPRIVYASCNVASFARDARILCNGGYRLTRVTPIDQFIWSPHVELAAVFERE